MTELDSKLEPNTVKVKPAPPAVVLVGERVVIVGAGFGDGGGTLCVDTPPPHPARNTALTIPKITSPLTNAFLLFIFHLPLGFSRNPQKCQTIPTHPGDVVLVLAVLVAANSPHDSVHVIGIRQAEDEELLASIDDHKVTRNAAVKVQKPACTVGIYFVGTVKRGIGEKIPHGYSVSTYGLACGAMSTGTVKRDKPNGGQRAGGCYPCPEKAVRPIKSGYRAAFCVFRHLCMHGGDDP
jgi:hypothetical protein